MICYVILYYVSGEAVGPGARARRGRGPLAPRPGERRAEAARRVHFIILVETYSLLFVDY